MKRRRWLLIGSLALIVSFETMEAQVVITKTEDIAGGLADSSITASVAPDSVDLSHVFDGNNFTEATVPNSDTLVITLHFTKPDVISKAKVFFWTNVRWLLDAASSESDLASHTGSYRLLQDSATCNAFAGDSVTFAADTMSYLRLRARTLDASLIIGDWTLVGTQTFVRMEILPHPVQIIPGATLSLKAMMVDDQGTFVPFPTNESANWAVKNTAVASVDANGHLTGNTLGTTEIDCSNDAGTLKGSATVSVLTDFRPQLAPKMTIKVALVAEDPLIQTGNRLHVQYGWKDPIALANSLVKYFQMATDSVINFQIVSTINDGHLFTRYYGKVLSVPQYVNLLNEPNWTSLKAAAAVDSLNFDYRLMVNYYHFDSLRNVGAIDEVWVYAAPYLGMYESQLMGPDAFWWNSPPIKDGTNLHKLLSVMGLNYERGVDLAYHSFGHRMESAMSEAYQVVQGRPWNDKSPDPDPWDLFTRIDKDVPGGANVGNCHFPPNGQSDYDYGDTLTVECYADNWVRYPYLFNQHRRVNVTEWRYKGFEPLAESNEQLGYLIWFYNHIPRYTGITDGVLNNWWWYFVDFDTAMTIARSTPLLGVSDAVPAAVPREFNLSQNYPNPFNPSTTIQFSLPEKGVAKLRVYNLLGQEVAVLFNGFAAAGQHDVVFNADRFASGVYFARLEFGGRAIVKKLLLMK